jgi:hypothetical protein
VTTTVRLSVPDSALGGVTETLLRVGIAAAVLEHLGEEAEVELATGGPDIHLTAQVGRRGTDRLVSALDAWMDDVLGSAPMPRRARIEVDVPVRPQLPQGNPQVGRSRSMTGVTSWG